jgi:alpha,alpha-trehalase
MKTIKTKMKTVIISIILGMISINCFSQTGTEKEDNADKEELLLDTISQKFAYLQSQCIRPAERYIKYDYLIPAGFYKQMWDWDGFFIGCHLASKGAEEAKYLKWWVLNFAGSTDSIGYVPGCITTEGPRPIFGKFSMKPFICQGAYLVSKWTDDFRWINPTVYEKLKLILSYRESTQYDPKYGLFFWDNAMQSGADNNVALTNDENDKSAILATDINTFQFREYISMSKIARELGNTADAINYERKAKNLKNEIIKYLWFNKEVSFFNIRRDNGLPIKRISYSNFVPLIEGEALLPLKEGRAMIRKYLWNKEHMLAPFGLRSLSEKDSDYNNEAIIIPYSNWQGPVWIVANYLYFTALKKYGFDKEAKKLSVTLAELVFKDIETCGSMHEDYHSETGAPLAPTAEQSKNGIFTGFIGWNLLVENMLKEVLNKEKLLLNL